LPELHVGLELGLTLLQVAFALPQFEDSGVDELLREVRGGDCRRRLELVRRSEDRSKRRRLLRGNLDPEDERTGNVGFLVRHSGPQTQNRPPAGRTPSLARANAIPRVSVSLGPA